MTLMLWNGTHGRTKVRFNGFLLCLCSPVLHKMLCGDFQEGKTTEIDLKDVEPITFSKVLDLWCGKVCDVELGEVLRLARAADRLQMTEVTLALDEAVMRHLDLEVCGEVLNWSAEAAELNLIQTEREARKLATDRFEELVYIYYSFEDLVRTAVPRGSRVCIPGKQYDSIAYCSCVV